MTADNADEKLAAPKTLRHRRLLFLVLISLTAPIWWWAPWGFALLLLAFAVTLLEKLASIGLFVLPVLIGLGFWRAIPKQESMVNSLPKHHSSRRSSWLHTGFLWIFHLLGWLFVIGYSAEQPEELYLKIVAIGLPLLVIVLTSIALATELKHRPHQTS